MNRFIRCFEFYLDILLKSLLRFQIEMIKCSLFFIRLLKREIDDALSEEKILSYLTDLRTKVLWPDDTQTSAPMKNVKHRAYNTFINKIPSKITKQTSRFLIFFFVCRVAAIYHRCRKYSSDYNQFTSMFQL